MGEVIAFPTPTVRAARRAEQRTAIEVALSRCLDLAETYVAALDRVDGDADLEPEPVEADVDAEPSLGAPVGGDSQVPWAAGGSRDLEAALARLGWATHARRSTEGA